MTKVLLLSLYKAKAKESGKQYARATGLTVKSYGEKQVVKYIESFVPLDQVTPEIEARALTTQDVGEIFEKYETVNISFDENGNIETIEE